MKRTKPKTQKELFKLDGQTWYILEDISSYPAFRFLNALNEMQAFSLNFSRESLKAKMNHENEVLQAVIVGGDNALMRKQVLEPIIKANKEAIRRVDGMTLPRVACKVLAWLIYSDSEPLEEEPSQSDVEERANRFWDEKKKTMLDLIFTRPFATFAKHTELRGFDSVQSLKEGMIVSQAIADNQNSKGIAD